MYEEEVNGTIIGGDYVSWCLFYDNRPQTQMQTADNDEEALTLAIIEKNRLINEFGGYPLYLYPDKSKWELRVW